jgi:hypothetical protein
MTRILNNLEIVGTGSNTPNIRALGVTGGFVGINQNIKVGGINQPNSMLDVQTTGTNSLTSGLLINNLTNQLLKYSDDGSLFLSGLGLTFGATNSIRQTNKADLTIGTTASGSISLNDYGIEGIESSNRSGLEFYLRNQAGLSSTYSRAFRFNTSDGGFFSLLKETGTSSVFNFPTNTNSSIRISSTFSNHFFRITTNDITNSQISRFGVESNATYSLSFFDRISKLNVNNISIQTIDNITGGYPIFMISSTQSSVQIGLTSTNNPSIFIIPGQNISLTASYTSGTSSYMKNIFIGTLMNSVPQGTTFSRLQGNQNIFIGSRSQLTSGFDNISLGERSLENITNGQRNISIGVGSLQSSTQSISNISLGFESGRLSTGDNNVFIGNGAGSNIYTQSNVLFVSNGSNLPFVDILQSTNNATAGVVPSWSFGNAFGNIASLGSEGDYYPSLVSSTGSYKTIFIGKGIWHYSNSLNTYAISTSMPALNYFTSSAGLINSNVDSVGSNFELVAGVGRGSGTAGDLYFSTGRTVSTSNLLQDKVVRMTIKGNSGRVGIGEGTFSQNPDALLHITSITASNPMLKLVDGSQGVDKVLVSDAYGNATWKSAAGASNSIVGIGSASFIPLFTGTISNTLTNSNIYQATGTYGTILIGYTISSSNYNSDTNTLRVLGDVYFDNSTITSQKFFLNGSYLFDDVNSNLALGYQSMGGNTGSAVTPTRGQYNMGIGYQSLNQIRQNSDFNLGLGYHTLLELQSGTQNIALGYFAMRNMMTASNNISIGAKSLGTTFSIYDNIAIGFESLIVNRSNRNIAIGHNAGHELIHSGTGSNVFLGFNSGAGFISGSYNTFITSNGNNSLGLLSGDNNIIIGQNITVDSTSRNGNIIIGNSFSTKPGLTNSIVLSDGSGNQRIIVNEQGFVGFGTAFSGTPTPQALVDMRVLGTGSKVLRIVDGSEGLNKVLLSDSQGFSSWATLSNPTTVQFGLTVSGSPYSPTFSVLLKATFSALTFSTIENGLAVSPNIAGNGLNFVDGQLNWSYAQVVLATSSSFTVGANQNNYFFDITTGNNLITVTPPSSGLTNGFTFLIRKVDISSGIIQVAGVFEYSGSTNISTLTRSNQTIAYVYSGVTFTPYTIDEGVISPSTVLANVGATYSPADEVAILDIHDTAQQALTYNQGGFENDWLSGVIYSAYGTQSFVGSATPVSVFATQSNKFIGSTISNTLIPAFSLTRGKTFKLSISGTVSLSSSLTFNSLVGGATVSSTTINSVNNGFIIDFTLKTMNVGINGSVHGFGMIYYNGTSVASFMNTPPYTTVNTAISNRIDFTISSSGTPNITIFQSMIERLT